MRPRQLLAVTAIALACGGLTSCSSGSSTTPEDPATTTSPTSPANSSGSSTGPAAAAGTTEVAGNRLDTNTKDEFKQALDKNLGASANSQCVVDELEKLGFQFKRSGALTPVEDQQLSQAIGICVGAIKK